jgi:hypothetical protein
MTPEFRQKQAELMTATVAKNDMVICTALVQGGKAPVLVTQAMVDGMRPGSVVVDLASDGGGNCAATQPGQAITTEKGVKVLGYLNWPGRIPVAASTLYAKNLLTFLTTFWDKDAKTPKLPPEDDIVKGVMLTRGGAIVHKNFEAAATASAAVEVPKPEVSATKPAAAEAPAKPKAPASKPKPPASDAAPKPAPGPAAKGKAASSALEPPKTPNAPKAQTDHTP